MLLMPLLVVAAFFVSLTWGIAAAGLLLAYLFSLGMGVPRALVNRDLVQAVLRLPKAIFLMVGTLFQIKKANKTFIHTVHTKTEVSNNLYKDKVS